MIDTKIVAYQKEGDKLTPINDAIDGNKNVHFKINFKVPTKFYKPKPAKELKHNDYIDIQLGEGFKLTTSSSERKEIKVDGQTGTIGSYQFALDQGKAVLKIKFDGTNKTIFNDMDFNAINIEAWGELEIDKSAIGEEGKDFIILGHTFKVIVPPVLTISKEGMVDKATHTIKWTVKMTGKRGDNNIDFKNYVLEDDLTAVGTYKEGSFRVNGKLAEPTIQDKKLIYKFPQGSTPKEPENILETTFETLLTPLEFRGSQNAKSKTELTKSNTVALKDVSGNEKAQDKYEVKWNPDFLDKQHRRFDEKTGKEITLEEARNKSHLHHYETSDGKYRIDWYIDVN